MSAPIFGYGGEEHVRKGRTTVKRDRGGHERWADAILPADAEAGVLETPTNRRPLWIIVTIVIVAAAVLAAQLVRLQIVNGGRNLGLAQGNRLRQTITRAPRGIIYDRTGKTILAQNEASFEVTVTPSLLPQDDVNARQAIYVRAGSLLNVPAAEIAAKAEGDCETAAIAAKTKRETAIAECLISTQPRVVATNIDRDTALNFDQNLDQVSGFNLDTNQIRQYNDNGALAAILGYTGRVDQNDLDQNQSYVSTDYIGKLGIEKQYEDLLRGQNGSEQTEVDAGGRPIKVLASKPAKAGSNLVLTVDSELEQHLSAAIKTQMQASGASQAAGVALNPKTGEVLAAVNLPTYDNNLFAKGISAKDYAKLVGDKAQPLFNKVTGGGYPTGSIIKPLISAAALQEGVINSGTTVNDTGSIVVKNKYDPSISYTYRSYTDYESGYSSSLGVVNVVKALAVSSDVFFYTVGGGFGNIAGLGVDKLTSYYQKFGLGRKPNVDVPEQTAGRVPTPSWKQKMSGQPWTVGDTYNISIGQGDLLASPLQMAVAEAAIANGGKVVEPHFLKSIETAGGQTQKTIQPKIEAQNFLSQSTLNTVKQGMHDVVYASYGTACCKLAEQVPVQVGAKTGTAQTNENDDNAKPNAWFTAFAPFDDPQIEIVVLIPSAGEGAKYAAPAVRETLAWCFSRPGGCVQ